MMELKETWFYYDFLNVKMNSENQISAGTFSLNCQYIIRSCYKKQFYKMGCTDAIRSNFFFFLWRLPVIRF